MADLENMAFLKLRPTEGTRLADILSPFFCEGEKILQQYQGIRDGVVFTNKRIIAVNTQGVTGKKKMMAFLPYRSVQAYALQSAGVLDFDSELKLWFAGLGVVTFELASGVDIYPLGQILEQFAPS